MAADRSRTGLQILDATYADMVESMNRFNREFERLQNEHFGRLDDNMFDMLPTSRSSLPWGRSRPQPLAMGDYPVSQALALPGSGALSPWPSRSLMPVAPRMDIRDDGDKLVIKGDVPGMDRESLKVSVENGMLKVSGEQQKCSVEEKNAENSKFFLKERGSSSFFRTVPLPENVIDDEIKARLNNGVLEIVIPKDTKAIKQTSKSIAIE